MHVFMTCGTGDLREVINRRRGSALRLVAFIAGNCDMTARQRIARFLMHRQGIAGGLEGRAFVALLAPVIPRRAGKLSLMLVLVAFNAGIKFDLEPCRISCRNMALRARHVGMRKYDRISSLCVIRDSKRGRAPAVHGVTAFALAAVRSLGELATMRIGVVAVGADLVWHRLFEIFAFMAGYTVNLSMLAQQRKCGRRMIELRHEPRSLPRHCCVAGVAAGLELAFVRIAVAIRAVGKFQPRPTRLPISTRRVTALAEHCAMCPEKRKSRLGMIKGLFLNPSSLPICGGVAL